MNSEKLNLENPFAGFPFVLAGQAKTLKPLNGISPLSPDSGTFSSFVLYQPARGKLKKSPAGNLSVTCRALFQFPPGRLI